MIQDLAALESRIAEAFEHDGDEVVSCKAAEITALVPTMRSRLTRGGGQRVVSLKMQTLEEPFS